MSFPDKISPGGFPTGIILPPIPTRPLPRPPSQPDSARRPSSVDSHDGLLPSRHLCYSDPGSSNYNLINSDNDSTPAMRTERMYQRKTEPLKHGDKCCKSDSSLIARASKFVREKLVPKEKPFASSSTPQLKPSYGSPPSKASAFRTRPINHQTQLSFQVESPYEDSPSIAASCSSSPPSYEEAIKLCNRPVWPSSLDDLYGGILPSSSSIGIAPSPSDVADLERRAAEPETPPPPYME